MGYKAKELMQKKGWLIKPPSYQPPGTPHPKKWVGQRVWPSVPVSLFFLVWHNRSYQWSKRYHQNQRFKYSHL